MTFAHYISDPIQACGAAAVPRFSSDCFLRAELGLVTGPSQNQFIPALQKQNKTQNEQVCRALIQMEINRRK